MEDKDCRTADKEAGAPQPVLVWKVWKTAIVVGKRGQAQLFAERQWKSFCFNLHDMEECGSFPAHGTLDQTCDIISDPTNLSAAPVINSEKEQN